MKKVRVTKRQLGAYIRNLLKEGSGRSTDAEVIYDDNSNVNSQFIQLMYDATVSGTGTTGFGFVFEELLIKNASNFGLTSPKGLNISGDTNTEFADVIADGDVYYSFNYPSYSNCRSRTVRFAPLVNPILYVFSTKVFQAEVCECLPS